MHRNFLSKPEKELFCISVILHHEQLKDSRVNFNNKYDILITHLSWIQKETERTCSRSRRRCSINKGVLKNFTKFTGKHLRQSLFFNNIAGLRPKYHSKFFLGLNPYVQRTKRAPIHFTWWLLTISINRQKFVTRNFVSRKFSICFTVIFKDIVRDRKINSPFPQLYLRGNNQNL